MRISVLLFVFIFSGSDVLLAQMPIGQADKHPDSTFLANPKKPSAADMQVTDGTSMVPANDITTNVLKSKELSSFYKTIFLTGLNETFKSRGPITVFVPDDSAFNKLSAGKLDTLLMVDHKYDLIALITYHAISGKITVKDISRKIASNKGLATFTTIAGSKLKAKFDDGRNIILIDENGGQSIINKADIEQSNGLIHIIDSVLIPKFKAI